MYNKIIISYHFDISTELTHKLYLHTQPKYQIQLSFKLLPHIPIITNILNMVTFDTMTVAFLLYSVIFERVVRTENNYF